MPQSGLLWKSRYNHHLKEWLISHLPILLSPYGCWHFSYSSMRQKRKSWSSHSTLLLVMQADALLSPSLSLAHHCQFSPSHPYWNLGDYSCYLKDQGFPVHPCNILSQPLILNTIYTTLICSLWSHETQPYFPQTFKNTSINTNFIFTILIMISV